MKIGRDWNSQIGTNGVNSVHIHHFAYYNGIPFIGSEGSCFGPVLRMSWPRQTAQPGIVSCLEDHHVRFLMLRFPSAFRSFRYNEEFKEAGWEDGCTLRVFPAFAITATRPGMCGLHVTTTTTRHPC